MWDTNFDPYAILGVQPNAELAEIKMAYRAAVLRCHPDRGGTHEDMVRVAAAWEVLSDLELRAQFDRSRSRPTERSLQTQWDSGRRTAHARAQAYARTWETLLQRAESIMNDAERAEYGSALIGFFPFPTAAKSTSAAVFIGVAAALGLVVFLLLFPHDTDPKSGPRNNLYAGVFVCAVSAWIGYRAHRSLRDFLRQRSACTLLECLNCRKTLRLPSLASRMHVKCPACSREFDHEPDWKSCASELEETLKLVRQDRKALGIALFATILVSRKSEADT